MGKGPLRLGKESVEEIHEMSVRDEKQALEPHIDTILGGIEKFNAAVRERIHSQDWKATHLLELQRLRQRLLDLEADLVALKHTTW